MQCLLCVSDDEVETEVDAPESAEEARHDEEVGEIGEGGPVHLGLRPSAARPFAGDEVGGDEGDEDDEGDDCSFPSISP